MPTHLSSACLIPNSCIRIAPSPFPVFLSLSLLLEMKQNHDFASYPLHVGFLDCSSQVDRLSVQVHVCVCRRASGCTKIVQRYENSHFNMAPCVSTLSPWWHRAVRGADCHLLNVKQKNSQAAVWLHFQGCLSQQLF